MSGAWRLARRGRPRAAAGLGRSARARLPPTPHFSSVWRPGTPGALRSVAAPPAAASGPRLRRSPGPLPSAALPRARRLPPTRRLYLLPRARRPSRPGQAGLSLSRCRHGAHRRGWAAEQLRPQEGDSRRARRAGRHCRSPSGRGRAASQDRPREGGWAAAWGGVSGAGNGCHVAQVLTASASPPHRDLWPACPGLTGRPARPEPAGAATFPLPQAREPRRAGFRSRPRTGGPPGSLWRDPLSGPAGRERSEPSRCGSFSGKAGVVSRCGMWRRGARNSCEISGEPEQFRALVTRSLARKPKLKVARAGRGDRAGRVWGPSASCEGRRAGPGDKGAGAPRSETARWPLAGGSTKARTGTWDRGLCPGRASLRAPGKTAARSALWGPQCRQPVPRACSAPAGTLLSFCVLTYVQCFRSMKKCHPSFLIEGGGVVLPVCRLSSSILFLALQLLCIPLSLFFHRTET